VDLTSAISPIYKTGIDLKQFIAIHYNPKKLPADDKSIFTGIFLA